MPDLPGDLRVFRVTTAVWGRGEGQGGNGGEAPTRHHRDTPVLVCVQRPTFVLGDSALTAVRKLDYKGRGRRGTFPK